MATIGHRPFVVQPPWSCVSCECVNRHVNSVCSMCGSSREGRASNAHHRVTSASNSAPSSAWEVSSFLAKLIAALSTPCTTVFNSAVVGAFAVAGASVGAVAGAVAANATGRGLVRGAGVGAVAGAAVSVEALDLARLCFSGYSVAGAMERREGRLRGVYGNSGRTRTTDSNGADARHLERISHGRAVNGRLGSVPRSGSSRRLRDRYSRFAATTTSVASNTSANGQASNTSANGDPAHGASSTSRPPHNLRPLAIRRRGAEVDVRAREMERLVAVGDVERILRTLFRGAGLGDGGGVFYGTWNGVETRRDGVEEGDSLYYNSEGDGDGVDDDSDDDVRYETTGGYSRAGSRPASWSHALQRMFTASRLDTMSYEELLEMFGPGNAGVKPADAGLVGGIPIAVVGENKQLRMVKLKHASEDQNKTGRENIQTLRCDSCCVCLEPWGLGDLTKTLTLCGHTFHANCIDRWLTKERNACPVCRQVGVEETKGA